MHTSWTKALQYYGIQQPYRFDVAIPFLLSCLGLALLLVICTVLWSQGGLSVATPRFYFFFYIFVLLTLAAALSRLTAVSLIIVSWCTIELSLGLVSNALDAHRFGQTLLMPPNIVKTKAKADDFSGVGVFKYHPVLGYVPVPNTDFKERRDKEWAEDAVTRGILLNLSQYNGQEITAHHNSLGARGFEPTAADLQKKMIFAYGGSSTYDVDVTQGQTWVEQLQSELHGDFTVLNFGLPGYTTAQHVIQTALYEDVHGRRPVCALYYVGWNDITHAHIRDLDPAYANYYTAMLVLRKPDMWVASYSPLMHLANKLLRRRFDSVPDVPNLYGNAAVGGSDSRLEGFFIEHMSTIAAINQSRGVKTLFVAQLLNRDILESRPQETSTAFPLTRSGNVWSLQEHFNSILKDTAGAVGARYIDAGIENFGKDDFVDWGHFSPTGARNFAALIAKDIDAYCQ